METEKNIQQTFPKNTAGRMMITGVPIINSDTKLSDIEKLFFKKSKELETINYIYVVDQDGKLVGILSVKDLFRFPKETPAKDIMRTDLITARAHTDQEHIALLALRHNIKAVPVVDKSDRLIGIVPSDIILNILHSEDIEDHLKSAGVHSEEPAKLLISGSAGLHIKKRIPWLLLGLAGGILAALVVDSFTLELSQYLLLASFIPAVVYMADAVGSQSQIIFIRSLGLDKTLKLSGYIWREIKVGISLSTIFAMLVGIISFLIWKEAALSLIFAITFFLTILLAMAVAILLPWALFKLKYDPAVGSGPFATIVRDILSLAIYFGTATILVNWL